VAAAVAFLLSALEDRTLQLESEGYVEYSRVDAGWRSGFLFSRRPTRRSNKIESARAELP